MHKQSTSSLTTNVRVAIFAATNYRRDLPRTFAWWRVEYVATRELRRELVA